MARTPLLRSIRQLVRDLRVSRATGAPVDELPALRAEQRAAKLSRRTFLAGAAAGAAALAIPRGARAAGQPTVTVVGGGIAGLTCALTLRDKGYASTVYEASGRVGGRMFSNTNYFAGNQVSEWCGELIDTGHKTVRNLATRYNLTLDDLHAVEPAGSHETYFFNGQYYSKADATADFLDILDIVDADVNAAGYPTLYNASTPDGRELDNTSIREWINTRVPGGHTSALGNLLDTAYAIEYGADTRDQASLNLLYLLGFQPHPNKFEVFGESDETFHIRGGNQRLPEAIAADLGAAVQTGYKLVRLAKTSGGRYRCTFERGSGTTEVVSDFVVLALPFAVLANVDTSGAGFDAKKQDAITNLGRGHNGKLQLQFAQRGWNGAGPWPGKSNGSSFTDAGYQASWDVTRAQPGPQGILVLYSGGGVTDAMKTTSPFATATDSKVIQDANRGLTQLSAVYPNLAWNGRVTQSLPHRSNLFGASYAYWKVGQYTRFGGYEGAPQGGVYFCGEHTSQDFQGFMEGGASTGKATAKDLFPLLK
ncbi:MAG: FAD-dependent oxidoreductase [Myxococcales bacterium]|nr:FAD-dependent oxidoreductase [Myxococcales bacterium]